MQGALAESADVDCMLAEYKGHIGSCATPRPEAFSDAILYRIHIPVFIERPLMTPQFQHLEMA